MFHMQSFIFQYSCPDVRFHLPAKIAALLDIPRVWKGGKDKLAARWFQRME